ncbi:MAG: glutamate 5-kinase [Oligosphaeraceae bacterium]|nr:glutamate 5-kinase [Oligosphaeraceae bacterium]
MSIYSFQDQGERAQFLPGVKRVVVKVGTQLLRGNKRVSASERIAELVQALDQLRRSGQEVILVSSGAVGFGMAALGMQQRPRKIACLQALAALGQSHLMGCYGSVCEAYGFHCAQLLLTAADLHDRKRNGHVTQCINALLEKNVLPIINENDSVCVDEIKVGDNDTLAAYVASMLRADLTVVLTTVDGMLLREEGKDELGPRLSVVRELTEEVMQMAQGTDGNQFSVGGMITKLRAAQIVNHSGEALLIANGKEFDILTRIMAGEDLGTLFLPARKNRLHARQRFLAFFSEPTGSLIIDPGAEKAILKNNRSLLPGGVLGSMGVFHRGDTVLILNSERKELARGIVNFAFDEVAKICGKQSKDLGRLLGREVDHEEIVHRDFMVLTG